MAPSTETIAIAGGAGAASPPLLELSIVIPCLNEAETLGRCIAKANAAVLADGIPAEIIVADNGSTDGSLEIAERLGAQVIRIPEKGYGNALMGGIAAARGRFVLMADGDDSYDLGEAPRFVAALRQGYDLVQGCRVPSGGGTVQPGAMPFLHRVWGNPMFSALARWWFGVRIHDIQCGMRAFRADVVPRLDLRCTGMEFSSEMIIKAALRGVRITEIPITLWPDGRKGRKPHLRTFRDGWRNLRFYLLFSPQWLFLGPGLVLGALGIVGYLISLPRMRFGQVEFDVHTMLFASLALILSFQAVVFMIMTKVFAITHELLPWSPRIDRVFRVFTLERGLAAGGLLAALGCLLLLNAFLQWRAVDFGPLDYAKTMRWVIPGVTVTTIGVQAVLSSFFVSILGLARR